MLSHWSFWALAKIKYSRQVYSLLNVLNTLKMRPFVADLFNNLVLVMEEYWIMWPGQRFNEACPGKRRHNKSSGMVSNTPHFFIIEMLGLCPFELSFASWNGRLWCTNLIYSQVLKLNLWNVKLLYIQIHWMYKTLIMFFPLRNQSLIIKSRREAKAFKYTYKNVFLCCLVMHPRPPGRHIGIDG